MKQQTDPMISDAFKNWKILEVFKILLPNALCIENGNVEISRRIYYLLRRKGHPAIKGVLWQVKPSHRSGAAWTFSTSGRRAWEELERAAHA